MDDRPNNRLRLLKELEIMRQDTNQDHPLNAAQLEQALSDVGIKADRKTIYGDIDALVQAGYDLVMTRGTGGGYYLAAPVFDKAELRVLADAIRAANFLSPAKTDAMLSKLLALTDRYDRKAMKDTLDYSHNKVDNEQIMYNIDAIQGALEQRLAITFRYFDTDIRRQRHYRAKMYDMVPYSLVWNQERYYLIGWDLSAQAPRHYRLDRMEHIEAHATDHQRKTFDVNAYMGQMVQMYNGPVSHVGLRCASHLAPEVIDQFGDNMVVTAMDDTGFCVDVRAMITQPFFGWVAKFGGQVAIIGPDAVKEQFAAMLRRMLDSMGENV